MANTRIFSFQAAGSNFALPVNPKECTITEGGTVKTVELLNTGEVGIAGNRKLLRLSISNTFLPSAGSHFYTGQDPESILTMMRKAKDGRLPVRIIISGTDINRQFLIEKLDHTYKEGQGDVYIGWSFVEYRETTVTGVASLSESTDTGLGQRASDQEIPKAVTVKKGMTLWGLAKKYYGDGTRWKEIAEENGVKDERKLQIGTQLVIP